MSDIILCIVDIRYPVRFFWDLVYYVMFEDISCGIYGFLFDICSHSYFHQSYMTTSARNLGKV